MINNKKAQGMSTSTIILLILGVVVLVVLILGFTLGWKNIAPWISSSNVDTIVSACGASCAVGGNYDYCFLGRDLKAEDVTLEGVTCNYLAKEQSKYGVDVCGSISCDEVVVLSGISDVGELSDTCEVNPGKVVQALIDGTLESFDCALNE